MRLFFFFLILDPLDPNQLLYILLIPLLFPFYFIPRHYLHLLFLLLLFLHHRRLFDDKVIPVELHKCLCEPLEVRVLQTRHQLELTRPQLMAG
jgi:hypothetical protein